MKQSCLKCGREHRIFYLIKANNTRAMFMLCPEMKGSGESFVLFLPLREELDIPSFLSGSDAYESLKSSIRIVGKYSEFERRTITAWQRGTLTAYRMTKEQLVLIRLWVNNIGCFVKTPQ